MINDLFSIKYEDIIDPKNKLPEREDIGGRMKYTCADTSSDWLRVNSDIYKRGIIFEIKDIDTGDDAACVLLDRPSVEKLKNQLEKFLEQDEQV